ncbi:MAG: acyl carrier protein [Bacteroidota bacterium]
MEKEEITEKIRKILVASLGHENFEMKENLSSADVDGWDSLTHMIIITEIEKEFKVNFKLKELGKLNNLGSLISLISSKL